MSEESAELYWEDRGGYTYWIVRGRGFWDKAEALAYLASLQQPAPTPQSV